jgi:hypothetical protein
MTRPPDVWKLLYDREALDRAQHIFAASIGADVDHAVLTGEILSLYEWVEEGDAGHRADRFVKGVAALVMLARYSHEHLATFSEWAKLEEGEPDHEAVQDMQVHLLNEYAEDLRRQLDDDAD